MKWSMTLNICMMLLKKILELNYTYVSLKQPMAKIILWRVTIFSQRMGEKGGLFWEKDDDKKKNILQNKWGHVFLRVM